MREGFCFRGKRNSCRNSQRGRLSSLLAVLRFYFIPLVSSGKRVIEHPGSHSAQCARQQMYKLGVPVLYAEPGYGNRQTIYGRPRTAKPR
jgi:hypothetical protein